MSRRLGQLLLCILVAGCGAGASGPDPQPSPTPAANADLESFQQILDGQIDEADGLLQIARSGGWPIETEDGFVFARLDDGRGPYRLAGDHNEWTPSPMTLEAGVHWTRVPIADPTGKRYEFVTAAGSREPDPNARAYNYDGSGERSLVRGGGTHLERYPMLTDGVVSPRTLRIWVPLGPVVRHLYVQDGQNLFDPDAPFGGWNLQGSTGDGTLVIGIDSNADRIFDYTHVTDVVGGQTMGGGGDAYADFVQFHVRPFVEQRYGTPSVVGVMGSSLGGLISFHIAHRHPTAYDYAASLSGTFGWGRIRAENQSMIERYSIDPPTGTKLYLDSGGGPGSGCIDTDGDGVEDDSPDATDNYCENRQLADILASGDWRFDETLWYWWEAGAPHNEAAWSARVFRPVRHFEAMP